MAQENVNENQEEALEIMPGADALPEEEQGQDFKVLRPRPPSAVPQL